MDSRSFNSHLAAAAGISAREAAILTDHLSSTLRQALSELDNVAIPGFGTFHALKTDEHIETDPERRVSMLMPPTINVEFTPGTQLRKTAEQKASQQ